MWAVCIVNSLKLNSNSARPLGYCGGMRLFMKLNTGSIY